MYTPVCIFGWKTPLSVGRRQYLLLQETAVTLTQSQAEAEAKQRLLALEKETLNGAKIVEKQEQADTDGKRYCMQADYVVEELISVQSEIFVNDATD
jgi:hypothetical protein